MSNPKPNDLPDMEIPNTHVAEAAHQFRETAELLFHQLPHHNCILPLLMVSGFAIELALKSLNSRNIYHDLLYELGIAGYRVTAEPIQKGHSIVQLFEALEPAIQRELQHAYAGKPSVPGKALIKDALTVYDGIFVNSRYPFENGATLGEGSINGLIGVTCIIDDYVRGLKRRSGR